MRRSLLAVVVAAACSQEVAAPPIRYLDRPGDIAFGCTEEVASASGSEFAIVPTSRCVPPPPVPDGGVDATPSETESWGFVVEGPRGTVAVANLSKAELRDSDPLTPGYTGLPVGRLPAEIATLPDGCFLVTANSGSCDVGIVDVETAILAKTGAVTRREIHAAGVPLAASPVSIAAPPPLAPDTDPASCEAPAGLVYLAYPACHAVAVVDSASGDVVSSVRYGAIGTPPTIAGGDLSCPIECPDVAGAVAGAPLDAPEPIHVSMAPDGLRLYVGFWDTSELDIVDLDAGGLPVAVTPVPLENAGGVERIAVSGDIEMGNGGVAGVFRFAYAVARDRTIHVVDVTPAHTPIECDAQIDVRYLHEITDASQVACIPIGAFPRRVDAIGPGIVLPYGAVPRDVGFFENAAGLVQGEQPLPERLNGVFAIVVGENPLLEHAQGGRGSAYYVNVDDDNYEDFEVAEAPGSVHMQLAPPHVVRDDALNRRQGAEDCIPPTQTSREGQPRNEQDPTVSFLPEGYELNWTSGLGSAQNPTRYLPFLRRVDCLVDSDHRPVYEMSSAASSAVREGLFADLAAILTEHMVVTWEGSLTAKQGDAIREAGVVRVIEAGKMELSDPAGEFCDLGVERWDTVRLAGCSTDFDCGLGETCFVHPDAPEGASGMCVIAGEEAQAADQCRDILVASRRFLVLDEPGPSRLTLVPRPVVLNATPVGGCSSDDECQAVFAQEKSWIEQNQMTTLEDFAYACQAHPAFRGETKCVQVCAGDGDCSAGAVCDVGKCVYGRVPDHPECVAAVQRYEVDATDAFVVLGGLTGYRHHRILDGDVCVDDVTAHPLTVGRFHRVEEPCVEGDPQTTLIPNPCSFVAPAEPTTMLVDNGDGTLSEVFATRPSQGIRLRLPGFTLEVVDVSTPIPTTRPGIAEGLFYSPLPSGYQIQVNIAGGFEGRFAGLEAAVPERVRRDPGGTLWVIDSGDAPANPPLRGQIIQVTAGEIGAHIGRGSQ